MIDLLQAKLAQHVTRTYTIGAYFEGTTRKERRQNELQANNIIKDLQQTIGKIITPAKMDEAIKFVRQEGKMSGTKGAAKLAAYFKDRSNLGQVAYVTILAAANGTFDREQKIKHFIKFLQEYHSAAVEWLIFGRTPYLEWKLQHQLKVAYDYSRNLIHSARRTVDNHLPKEYQLHNSLPEVSKKDLISVIEQFNQIIKESFAKEEELSIRQTSFLKKLARVSHHRQYVAAAINQWLIEWNNSISTKTSLSSPHRFSRWRQFKQLTRDVEEWLEVITNKKIQKYSYLSVLRGCLISALSPLYQEAKTVKKLIENKILCAEQLIAKPFRTKAVERNKLIPLSLLMGSRYVVGRPGSSTVMTELAAKKGAFTITIWPPRRRKTALIAQLRFHRRVREMLTNGACLKLLVLRSTTGPSGKILIDLVMEGQYWMFLSKRRLKKFILENQQSTDRVQAIGLDINRVGPDMLAFSEEIALPNNFLAAIRHYINLEDVLNKLHHRLSIQTRFYEKNPSKNNLIRSKKLQQELSMVYARRARILKELHRISCAVTAQVLLQTRSPILCVEDLQLEARGARGALAKSILNMPDELDLYERAILLVFYLTGKPVILQRVDPRYTSQGLHVDCPVEPAGRLLRSSDNYDIAPCSACGSFINTHYNAACLIRDKILSLLSNSSSLSALPAMKISLSSSSSSE
ncbi:MAG: hypothetical protein ACFE95_10455 [Candidatus Hodarchaeota archaeon]